MKKTLWCRVLGLVFGVLLAAACAGRINGGGGTAAASPGAGCAFDDWTVLRETHFGQSTLSVMFGDGSFGVAADLGGGIHYTEDGGQTWHYTIKAGYSRVALEISEGNRRIWYIGYGGDVLLSTDRARTWHSVGPFPHNAHVEYISFADESNGWGMTTELRAFFATADGGKSWRALPFPEEMEAPAGLHLRTPREGYILDRAGNLYVSADGGDSWEVRSLGLAAEDTIPTLNHSSALRFRDALHGVVVLTTLGGGTGRTRALRTSDGGITWSEESLPVPMGMFHLTRDGVLLTHVDLYDQGKITLVCSARALPS
jgi:photosystem II stability/assembly factor-like uncharacterized protein